MKITRIFIFVLAAYLFAGKLYGQTAGEVIEKYLSAIGGKEKISNIKSFYFEGKMQVMGMEVKSKTTVLNGMGWRQEIDMMSQNQITCLNEKGGWLSLPLQGSAAPTDMPADIYNKAKSKMIVGDPFVNYQANDNKVELAGNEAIGGINAIKLKMVKQDNNFDTYYFDPASFFLIRSIQKENMRGQEVEITMNYSNYKDAGKGYMYPFTTESDMGNGMKVVTSILVAEVDKAVDPAIFNKP
ncbi:MAG: hypothetical protein WCK18_19715 [Prolixibacteraceae bacterium]